MYYEIDYKYTILYNKMCIILKLKENYRFLVIEKSSKTIKNKEYNFNPFKLTLKLKQYIQKLIKIESYIKIK